MHRTTAYMKTCLLAGMLTIAVGAHARVRTHKTDSAEWDGFWCCPLK